MQNYILNCNGVLRANIKFVYILRFLHSMMKSLDQSYLIYLNNNELI